MVRVSKFLLGHLSWLLFEFLQELLVHPCMSPVAFVSFSTHGVGLLLRLEENENQTALLRLLIFIYFSPLSRKISHEIFFC